MLEKEVIQYRGFRNVYDEAGNACGFEFRMRTTYYRGLWLSQLRVGSVYADGERFNGTITEISEKEITVDLNHPLAGKPLNFVGTVTENREATNEEIQEMVKAMSGGCGSCGGCGGGDCENGCSGCDCCPS